MGIASGSPFCYFLPFHYLCFHNNHNLMEINSESPRLEYLSPVLRVIPVRIENAICESPVPGGNEDIGYEDWD